MNIPIQFKLLLVAITMAASNATAATVVEYLSDAEGNYSGPTVEDNVASMDLDKNGFADASEVRAFLELKHGKGYQSALLEKFEASVKGASCASPFSNKLYVTD